MIAMALVHNRTSSSPTSRRPPRRHRPGADPRAHRPHQREFDIGVVLITHDLGVIADVAQTVMVMYAGRAMELGSRDAVFTDPCIHTHGACWNHGRASTKENASSRSRAHRRRSFACRRVVRSIRAAPHRFEPCDKEIPAFKDRAAGIPRRATWRSRTSGGCGRSASRDV